MFVGHYTAALIAKSVKPTVSLGALFLAAQAVDILWALLVLVGVEHARLVAGVRGFAAFRLEYMPWTHSLVAAVLSGAAVWFVVRRWRPTWGTGAAWPVAIVVATHWLLDAFVHRADLPLYDSRGYLGTGLWDSAPGWALLVEVVPLLLMFFVCWLRTGRKAVARAPLVWFAAFLVLVQVCMAATPLRSMPPLAELSERGAAAVLAVACTVFYFVCSSWARIIDTEKLMSAAPPLAGLPFPTKKAVRWSRFSLVLGIVLVLVALFILAMGIWYRVNIAGVPLGGWNAEFFEDSVGVLLFFAAFLTIGITALGFSKILLMEPKKKRLKRFWWEGCEQFATGIRVVFLIPLSLVCWLGIVAAFHVVWQQAPSQQNPNKSAPVPAARGSLTPSRRELARTVQGVNLDSTIIAAPSGSVRLPTTISIIVRDSSGQIVLRPEMQPWLVMRISTESGEQQYPEIAYEESLGRFLARYTPTKAGSDSVQVTFGGKLIGRAMSRVEISGAPALSQTWNLVFLPIALLMGWLLLWPSRPEDDVDESTEVERAAWLEPFAQWSKAVEAAVIKQARDQIEADKRPPPDKLERYVNEELRTPSFVAETAPEVIAAIAKQAAERADGIIRKESSERWEVFEKRGNGKSGP